MSQNNQIKQYNFTQEQVTKLFTMQDQLNTYIHPEWKTQGFNWDLAIVDECMEIHGHLGWKWWKKDYKVGLTEANKKQVQLEVIDILHFVISSWVESGDERYLLENFNAPYPKVLGIEKTTNKFVEFVSRPDLWMECWVRLAIEVDLTEQEILETYTQKYVLNKFRQDHGYKDGSYCKEWLLPISIHNGAPETKEDNEVLSHVVNQRYLCGQDATDEQELYSELEFFYNSRLNQ